MTASLLTIAPSALGLYRMSENDGGIDPVLAKLARINDEEIEDLLAKQIDKPGDPWDGGVVDDYDLPSAHSITWFMIPVASAYACQHSRYYLAMELEGPLERAVNCLLRIQHDDGTIDLRSTNFHSTPDTAFLVNYLSPVYVALKALDRPGLQASVDGLGQFFLNAGKCLSVGGIHTANHRWVVSSALARLYSFFPEKRYVDRIDEWLSEGVDLDPDGQFVERSVGAYSPVCDEMFLTIGRLLERPHLIDIVRKNLDMTLYYIQPGGELMTNASGRQDNALTSYVSTYYYSYKYLAIKDKSPVYSAVCHLIEEKMPERITRYMASLMADSIFDRQVSARTRIPDNYSKRFSHSGIFRIRRGDTDISIIERNPTFLVFRRGDAVLQSIRLAASFFGRRGQFISEDAIVNDDSVILMKSITHGYFQPFPEEKRVGDGDWRKLPRSEREMSEPQTLNYRVAITESGGKIVIEIKIEGTTGVPVSLELSFRSEGEIHGAVADRREDDVYFLERGMGQYQYGNDVIKFGPGATTHRWAQMRGMLPRPAGLSVYVTGETPFEHSLELS